MVANKRSSLSSLQLAAKGSTLLQEKEKADPVKSDHIAKKEGDNLYVITGASSTSSNRKPKKASSLTRALTDSSSTSSRATMGDDDESFKSADSGTVASNNRRVSRRDRVSRKERMSKTANTPGDDSSTSSSLARAVNGLGGSADSGKKPKRSATSFDSATGSLNGRSMDSSGSGRMGGSARTSRSSRTASEPVAGGKKASGLQRFNTTVPRSSTKSSASTRFSRSNTNKPSKFGRSQTRIESNQLFKKMDSDKSKSVSLEEISELMVENQNMWGKMRQLSEHLNEPMSKTAQVAAKVALELATGKKGEKAAQAELTREEFHQFRKKYFIDPVGSEELFQKTVFQYFDADGSGELDGEELENFLDAIYSTGPQRRRGSRPGVVRRKSFSKEEMAKLVLAKYDVNGDETLSFNEVRSIISGGAGALSVLRAMAKEEEALSLSKSRSSEKDEDDDDDEDSDEEEDVGRKSNAADPRLQAARLLGLLQTEEEKEEEKKIAEEMEQMSDEEEEEEDDKDKDSVADIGTEEDEEEEEEEDEEDEEDEEELEEEEAAPPGAELTSSSERDVGEKGDLDGLATDNHNNNKSNSTLQTAGTSSSKDLSAELLEKRNKGMVLREFSTDFYPPPMRRSRHGSSKHGGGRGHEVMGEESEQEFDFCDWFDRKISPSSYPGGKKVEGRKNLCERGPVDGGCTIQ